MNPDIPDINVAPSFDVAPAINEIFDAIVGFLPVLWAWIKSLAFLFIGISIPLSIFFIIVIIYCVEQIKKIRVKEEAKYHIKVEPAYEAVKEVGNSAMAEKWESVKTHIASSNQNDWRQAIMDADIILDNLLTQMGYQGDSIGEKLKRVSKGDFATLNEAWEAHKVRNRVAHEGSNFHLNEREAQTTIDNYRRVFEEFYYI